MSMDRRTLLTALLGGCAAAGAMGTLATSAAAVPRTTLPRPTADTDLADATPESVEGEAKLHQAQIYIRRRRRWWRRPWRRRRRVYFY